MVRIVIFLLEVLNLKYISLSKFRSRVIKSAKEIEVLRYVAKVSSDAHKKVMKTIK